MRGRKEMCIGVKRGKREWRKKGKRRGREGGKRENEGKEKVCVSVRKVT